MLELIARLTLAFWEGPTRGVALAIRRAYARPLTRAARRLEKRRAVGEYRRFARSMFRRLRYLERDFEQRRTRWLIRHGRMTPERMLARTRRRYPWAAGLMAMTTNAHTDVAVGAAGNAAIFNAPYGQLDKAITDLQTINLQWPKYRAIGVWDPVAGTGDATAAIVQAIADTPVGGTLWAPVGIYNHTAFAINKSIAFLGPGWIVHRDSVGGWSDANYQTAGNFGGCLFRGTAASGLSVNFTVTETDMLECRGIAFIGPGSGSATGFKYGDGVHAIVDSKLDIAVMNYATGFSAAFAEEIDGRVLAMGCTNGVVLATNTNNNRFSFDIEKCNNSFVDDATCVNNTLFNPAYQANPSAVSMVINGSEYVLMGGFWQNPAGTRAIDIFGNSNTLVGTIHTTATDVVRINAGALNTRFLNPQIVVAMTWIDNGGGTQIEGRLNNLTVTGTDTSRVLQDLSTGMFSSDGGTSANDADANRWGWKVGADGTLGPSQFLLYGHPSATAGSRFWALRHQDNTGYRTIKLNDLGGQIQLASTGVLSSVLGPLQLLQDLWRSRQTPTEAVLVSGVNATAGELVGVTLTAARVVGAPLNPATGQRLSFTLIQGGAGAFAVTWNAIFKGITGGTSGATGTRATFSFNYDGTNWTLDGAQPTWVA